MTDTDVLEQIMKLEESYEQELSDRKRDFWVERFRNYSKTDFSQAIERVIRTRERFPTIATIYKALEGIGAREGKHKLRVVKPYILYKDAMGRIYSLCNSTGKLEGKPPNELKNENGEIVFFEEISQGGTPQFLNIVIMEEN